MVSPSDSVPRQDEVERPTETGSGDGGRRRGHRRRWIALAVLGFLVALSAVLVLSAMAIERHLAEGREAMQRGKEQLLQGDGPAAAASFADARSSFVSGRSVAGNPVLRVLGWVPFLGRTPDAVLGIASAGVETASAGLELAQAVVDLPGGLASLAPSDGAFPIDQIAGLSEPLRRADRLIGHALATIDATSQTLLIGPVGQARQDAQEQLDSLHDSVHAASLIMRSLPEFLGGSGPKHYFFGAQNPAELRGTGGIMGAYSILTIDRGRFRFSPFVPIHGLPAPSLEEVPPPNEDYATNYDQFRHGGRFWTSINVMPDFPSVAQAILNAYETSGGRRLDGVITTDPFALQALAGATGPTVVPGYGIKVDAENIVAFTANEAYGLFSDPVTRKRVLGDVAKHLFEQFVADPSPSFDDLKLLAQTAADGHIQVFSTDPEMEEGLRASPVGGALRPGDADFLSVVVNSAAGSKVDYYENRSISYSVKLGSDLEARGTAVVALSNEAPVSGQPRYVIGPNRPIATDEDVGPILEHLRAGESVALVNVYCAPDCTPYGPTLNGRPTKAIGRTDLGVPYVQGYFPILSGHSAEFAASWVLPHAWQGNDSGGTYRLTFANQVTIRPTRLRVAISPPEGMSISSVSDEMRVVNGTAVYEGTPGPRLELEVTFSPPLLTRLWRDVLRFLSKPVIRL